MNTRDSTNRQEHGITRTAERWLDNAGAGGSPRLQRVRERAAQELGRRTGFLPLVKPVVMLLFIALSPGLLNNWLPVGILYALMLSAALVRIATARQLAAGQAGHALTQVYRYQSAVDVSGFSWGTLVGLMLMVRGLDQLTELALLASLGITAVALTSLTFERSLWRRFVFMTWLPLIVLTAVSAARGATHGWLVLTLELLFVAFAVVLGQRVVRDYIAGLLSRSDLEQAALTIANQRDTLHSHQTRLDELSARAHRLSYYDQLTGLGSRAHFHERLEASILAARISGTKFMVLYLDLDGFKDVNDTLGHDAGDTLLRTVAGRACKLLRASDFAARLGSDELALLINHIDHDKDAACAMQRALKTIQHPVELEDKVICPRASIGVALYPDDGDNALSLLKAAESAMNCAKGDISQRYARYKPEMTLAAEQRLTIEQELRLALAERQFVLHYQPQIDTQSGATCGVEALVRWQHPQRGLVSPADFIPVAESTCMIHELGKWVLMSACLQAADWYRAGLQGLPVAVNISPLQLLDPAFVETVRGTLEKASLPVHLLELEITESALQTHPEARETLRQLNELGVRVSIDDFGTGYSSLASLKELPIGRVKIDRTLVSDMLASDRDTVLLGKIIDLIHVLGCDVVAEGVEERAHIDKLHSLSCDCLQGYYFSRPVEAEKIPAIAREVRARSRMPAGDRVPLSPPAAPLSKPAPD